MLHHWGQGVESAVQEERNQRDASAAVHETVNQRRKHKVGDSHTVPSSKKNQHQWSRVRLNVFYKNHRTSLVFKLHWPQIPVTHTQKQHTQGQIQSGTIVECRILCCIFLCVSLWDLCCDTTNPACIAFRKNNFCPLWPLSLFLSLWLVLSLSTSIPHCIQAAHLSFLSFSFVFSQKKWMDVCRGEGIQERKGMRGGHWGWIVGMAAREVV